MAKKENTPTDFVFSKQNYVLLLISLAVIVVGFALLAGGGSDNPNEFSEEIFSVRRLYVAPIIILGGYFLVIYAIMKKPNKEI
ncbi:MAG TPA: DUF3098 domain-containing protein [Flavobacteriales bacterium]|nr:DUF3098 domain-containing protein [Flavobacteriales bacterium]|tara:strand:+ start:14828 stop:15076 length:249 start_codon:yes stop_codon:yes gene_type:complete